MHVNKSGRFMALFIVAGLLLLGFVGLVVAQEGNAQALGWLKEHRKPVRPDEIVVSGILFTIVPTSHRMIVKSGNQEKTLVLGFGDDVYEVFALRGSISLGMEAFGGVRFRPAVPHAICRAL
jgi:hypothetical protein